MPAVRIFVCLELGSKSLFLAASVCLTQTQNISKNFQNQNWYSGSLESITTFNDDRGRENIRMHSMRRTCERKYYETGLYVTSRASIYGFFTYIDPAVTEMEVGKICNLRNRLVVIDLDSSKAEIVWMQGMRCFEKRGVLRVRRSAEKQG